MNAGSMKSLWKQQRSCCQSLHWSLFTTSKLPCEISFWLCYFPLGFQLSHFCQLRVLWKFPHQLLLMSLYPPRHQSQGKKFICSCATLSSHIVFVFCWCCCCYSSSSSICNWLPVNVFATLVHLCKQQLFGHVHQPSGNVSLSTILECVRFGRNPFTHSASRGLGYRILCKEQLASPINSVQFCLKRDTIAATP